jgi:hypothetical protein
VRGHAVSRKVIAGSMTYEKTAGNGPACQTTTKFRARRTGPPTPRQAAFGARGCPGSTARHPGVHASFAQISTSTPISPGAGYTAAAPTTIAQPSR